MTASLIVLASVLGMLVGGFFTWVAVRDYYGGEPGREVADLKRELTELRQAAGLPPLFWQVWVWYVQERTAREVEPGHHAEDPGPRRGSRDDEPSHGFGPEDGDR